MKKDNASRTILPEEAEKKLASSMFDEVTDLYSQDYIDAILMQQYCLFKRNFQRFGVAVVDIDKFDKIKENFGNSIENLVLKFVASTLKQAVRTSDFLARFEGNKFIIVCPVTELSGIEKVSARTINLVHSKVLNAGENVPESIKVSVSVGAVIVDYKDNSPTDIIARTKKVLFRAKEEGGDQYLLD